MQIDMYNKGAPDFYLAPYISLKEYECKCKSPRCIYTLVNPGVVHSFTLFRKSWGKPLTITSAYRCQAHNEAVGGLPNSFHTRGQAIDISSAGYNILELRDVAELFFDTVIVYETKNFIHCHNRMVV